MQEAEPARVTVTDLACRRGDRMLFARLSLALGAGEAVQVAGHNGIGKSSLLRIVAGLAPAYAGSVSVEGAIGLLDERPALDPALPLGKALAFWALLDGDAGTDHLRRLGLAALLDVPVRYLSTGQKKRAALARLLGQKAQVWLLDEPLNGLDSHAAELTEAIVAEHCASGGIAVIASHQPFRLAGMRVLPLPEYAA
ncbi:heme ABC exporter ATP-binding protein CcmA [Novosphingobium sp. AP12]|uniref:heme ABC exporter ATP-binding protein CcmA n=1 Tax=Novosphingobium sp. AP12 TaxID=1144305 RepID=UPI000271D8BF|nr:heme ABC exporter ATP-binding protein CcmA [Novosphingobium sp. AP12]EJL29443.1 heme ABC exporter, ATP-binding protein CcmA [Novosphingobium sp. AP12]